MIIKITKLIFIKKCHFYTIIENIVYASDVEAAQISHFTIFSFSLSRENTSECVIRFFTYITQQRTFVCMFM